MSGNIPGGNFTWGGKGGGVWVELSRRSVMGGNFPGKNFPRTENETPDLNSLKLSDFEPKTNIGDINSSSSAEEEGAEYKVKLINNSEVV